MAPAKLGFLPTRRSGLELSSTLGVEESDKRDGAVIGVPVRYRAERVEWLSGPLRSSESRSLSLGLGPHPDVDEVLRVSNIAGATVEHVTFTRRGTMAATKGLPPTDAFRKVFVGFDSEAVFTFDDGGERLVAAAQARIGWSWLEADRGGTINKDNAADVRVGMNAKLGRPDHQFRFGFGYGREPNRSANGDRLIADWRLDLSAGLEQKRGEVAVRGTLSLIESLAGATEGEDVSNLLRYGTHLEAFYKLGSGFQAGGYLVTNYEPIGSLDPWQQKRSLAREVGLTLRWRRPLHRR